MRIGGPRTTIGLGRYPVVTLAKARERALENARAIEEGRDPRQTSTTIAAPSRGISATGIRSSRDAVPGPGPRTAPTRSIAGAVLVPRQPARDAGVKAVAGPRRSRSGFVARETA